MSLKVMCGVEAWQNVKALSFDCKDAVLISCLKFWSFNFQWSVLILFNRRCQWLLGSFYVIKHDCFVILVQSNKFLINFVLSLDIVGSLPKKIGQNCLFCIILHPGPVLCFRCLFRCAFSFYFIFNNKTLEFVGRKLRNLIFYIWGNQHNFTRNFRFTETILWGKVLHKMKYLRDGLSQQQLPFLTFSIQGYSEPCCGISGIIERIR